MTTTLRPRLLAQLLLPVLLPLAGAQPVITGIAPHTVWAGHPTFTLTVTGTGFAAPGPFGIPPSAVVRFDGANLPTTFVSTSELRATVDASLVAGPGTATIEVSNPTFVPIGGTPPPPAVSNTALLRIRAPGIACLEPAEAVAGQAGFVLVVRGEDFVASFGGPTGSVVTWNGSGLPTTFVSGEELRATVDAGRVAAPGTATVQVENAFLGTVGGSPPFTSPSNTVAFPVRVPALSGTGRPGRYEPNGPVRSMVASNGVLYVGGAFSEIRARTGSGAAVSGASGLPVPPFPRVDGTVHAVAPDWNGGWYVGGEFTSVGGVPRLRLAHVRADGTVDPCWAPAANGTVYDLEVTTQGAYPFGVSVDAVYVGGAFTVLGGEARRRLAAVDGTSGGLLSWNPSVLGGEVRALAVSGSTVHFGGSFTSVSSATRNRLAAVDAATGQLLPWNPGADLRVDALLTAGSTVYAGGLFTSVGGQARNRLAAIDGSTGQVTPWNPDASGWVHALARSGSTIYAGGTFTSLGGQSRSRLAAIDVATGQPTPWNPGISSLGGGASVHAVAFAAGDVYVGGEFERVGFLATRSNVAAIDAGTGQPTDWNPGADGPVRALSTWGFNPVEPELTIYAGGEFESIGRVRRNGVAAFDLATGLPTSWDPDVKRFNEPGSVSDLALSGTTLYLAGDFTNIGGLTRTGIGAVDVATGAPTAFAPDADWPVHALAVSGTTVYAGGQFGTIGGQARSRIAALDATTGLATSWDPGADGVVHALAVSGPTVYAGGVFTAMGGASRNRIAALDAATGLVTAWDPHADFAVLALEVDGPTVYAGGPFTSIGGAQRNGAAALDAATGQATPWDPQPDTGVAAFAFSGGTVYAGGAFTSIGGASRSRLAALDAVSGQATPWDPELSFPLGAGSVNAIVVSGGTVHAGGTVVSLAPQFDGLLAAFDHEGPTAAPVLSSTSPATATAGGPGFPLTVAGDGFTPQSLVRWDGAAIPTTFVNATALTGQVDAGLIAAAGTAAVTVENPGVGGGTSQALTFTVENPAPVLSGLTPDAAPAGGPGLTVTLAGSGFVPSSTVHWNGSALPTTFVDPNELTAQVTATHLALPGASATITVGNPGPGGGTSLNAAFTVTYPVPAAGSLNPASVTAGSAGFTLGVSGSGFFPQSEVRWNGTPLPTSYVGPSEVHAAVPSSLASAPGLAGVTVTNPAPGGGTSGSLSFAVTHPSPSVVAISPATAVAGSPALTLTVTGGGFAPASTVRWDGGALPTTFVNSARLDALVGAALLAQAGTPAVSVSTPGPGGGSSAPQAFTVTSPLPALSSLTPSSTLVGGSSFVLSVQGTGFTVQSTVRWDGVQLPTSFSGPAALTAQVDEALIASAGTAQVTVENPAPGGGTSGALPFTVEPNPVPVLTALTPDGAAVGAPGLLLAAQGSDFVDGASVHWDGTGLPTTFVSATELQAQVPPALLASPGAVDVTVLNPAPGGGASAPLTFTVAAPSITGITPASITPLGPSSPPVSVVVGGAAFLPGSLVYANGQPLSTTFTGPGTLLCVIDASVPQAALPGGIALTVENAPTAISNTVALVVGGGSNQGTIIRSPLAPAPGGSFAVVLEGGRPGAAFSLFVDLASPLPVTGWPDPATNLVVAAGPGASSPGPWTVVLDGLGFMGPPQPFAYGPDGTFTLPGLILPDPPAGVTFTVQGAYVDPGSPAGFNLTWARYPDAL